MAKLDHYQCIQMKCSKDAAIQNRFVEERTCDFLAGLNAEYDAVRVQILGKSDLPSLNEAISIVRVEKGRRGVMLEVNPMEGSILLTLKGLGQERLARVERKASNIANTTNRDNLWCTYCKKLRHTIDKC